MSWLRYMGIFALIAIGVTLPVVVFAVAFFIAVPLVGGFWAGPIGFFGMALGAAVAIGTFAWWCER